VLESCLFLVHLEKNICTPGSSAFVDEYVRSRNIPIPKLLEAFGIKLVCHHFIFIVVPSCELSPGCSAQSCRIDVQKLCCTSSVWQCRTSMFCIPLHESIPLTSNIDSEIVINCYSTTQSRMQSSSSDDPSVFLYSPGLE
jgi:hypothetical protein